METEVNPLRVLRKIAKYPTTNELRWKNCHNYGLDYLAALEHFYESILTEAQQVINGLGEKEGDGMETEVSDEMIRQTIDFLLGEDPVIFICRDCEKAFVVPKSPHRLTKCPLCQSENLMWANDT